VIKTADAEEDQLKLRNTVSAANLTHSVKEIDIPSKRDKDGAVDMMASPVFPVDPNTNPILNRMPCSVYTGDGLAGHLDIGAIGATTTPVNLLGQDVFTYSVGYVNNGTQLEQLRSPTVYKNVQTAANGSTAIWTAGVGKKWRLMGVVITLGIGTTAAAGCDVSLLDVAADIGIGIGICTGAMLAVPNSVIVLQMDIKNGILAAATNTALNVTLSSAMAVNGVSVQVWGTEE
jgi:hypothetical protein